MRFCYPLLILFTVLSSHVFAQDKQHQYKDVGLEIQQYPTGFLYGLKLELGIKSHHAIDFRLGYNSLDHQDFGVHDSEIGGGFGGSIGYRYYFNSLPKGFFLGVRTDLWFNEIDWEDIENMDTVLGNTSVIVLQPTGMIGYSFLFKDHFVLTPTLALGAEINIKTKGEPVGEGAIVLWGLNFLYRF